MTVWAESAINQVRREIPVAQAEETNSMISSLSLTRPSVAASVSAELARRARWARDAHELDQEFGPVPAPVPMLDGETVSEWRARNRAAMEAARACGFCGAAAGTCACDSYGVEVWR